MIKLQAGKETIAETEVGGVENLNQSMYADKNSKNAFDFVNNVNNDFDNYKKAKYQFKNVKLSLPADIVRHDKNEHNMTANDWQEIEENIDNIYIANKANGSSSYGNNLYIFGIKTKSNDYYYLCVAINNKDNYIVTATKDHKNTVENHVMGKIKTLSKVPNALPPVAPFSKESSDNIITYIKEKLNPDILFQLKNNPKEPEKARGVYGKYRTSNFDACLSYNV